MRVDFEMLGEVQFSRELIRVGRRGGDLSPVLGSIADDWMDWIEEQFQTEGARASGGWAQLAPSTVKARGSAHPILQVEGALMRELTNRSNVLVTDSFAHLSVPDEVEEYGRYHQSGTSRMPQRRPIEFTDMDRSVMTRKLQRYVIAGLL